VLEADRAVAGMIRAVVVSKALAKQAQDSGLKRVKLTKDEKANLEVVLDADPALRKSIDVSAAFAPRKGQVLRALGREGARGEAVVVLLSAKAPQGYGSLLQLADDGTILGGLTLRVEPST